jgi:hypothetical protein
MTVASEQLMPHRVAIYAAPSIDDLWWERGSHWLGRCAFHRRGLPLPVIDGLDPTMIQALTAEPRRYGWHATLKAPMRLAPHVSLAHVRDSVAELCSRHGAIDLPDLQVTRLGGFLALCLEQPPPTLGALADDCVRSLQPLAAPLTEKELARRRSRPLTPEEDALMLAWGYPWVLQRFRFHFSLTGSLKDTPEHQVTAVEQLARSHFAGLPPLRLGHVSIFVEPQAGADFVLYEQMELKP